MIELYGLSPIERELADRMWSMETNDEVQLWMAALPTKRLRAIAFSIYTVIRIESDEEDMDCEDLSLARAVIDLVK